jgi:hypothetical protein
MIIYISRIRSLIFPAWPICIYLIFISGDVGNWKDWFTVAQNEQFENYLKEKMEKSKWTFVYDI